MSEEPSRTGQEVSAGSTRVGVVGLGDMGAGIAKSVLRGFPLTVCDLRPAAVEQFVALGADAAASVEELADHCEAVIIVVVNDKQVEQVVRQILAHPGKVRSIIISSTVQPATVIGLEAEAGKAGIAVIDAPVSGGAEKAADGIITILIGGSDPAVKACWPILDAFGGSLFHLGPAGAGSAGKLITNMLSLGGYMLQLEVMQFAAAHGISEDAATEFLPTTTADSRGLRTWGRFDRMRQTHTLAGTEGMYDIFSKDMKIAAAAAGQHGVVLPIVSAISAMVVEKARTRDRQLAARGDTTPIPRCPVCTFELASPYRKAGVHPECAGQPA